ncbi:MAG: 3-oxoacyl-[acyl-carrier protein] reductase [Armatimonadetes bacterium]|jgi:NAD(P)-dependent dehydrogenase (short-subunit alcohol dehydrogenase family)|nr:3-oxoacyl-[acyl-carrier protein] reductase [Armatimonadota bacterium]
MTLLDRVAIVTGAGRGIGRAIAHALAAEGCDVVLAARSEDELAEAARGVREFGRRALPVVCDVSDELDVRRLVGRAIGEFGHVNIVVNNAGGTCRKPLVEYTIEDWDHVMNGQVRGTFLVTRFALPSMLEQGWGRVLTIGSTAAHVGVANRSAYCTAKFGQRGFTEALDEELQGTGVRAHMVSPGPVATRMRAEGFPNEVPESLIQPEDVAVQAINLLTLPETAYIREVYIGTGLPTRYR